jgi:1,4-alpha-glucan branching enzyme
MSKLDWAEPIQPKHAGWLARYRRLLEIRRREIVPRLRDIEGFAGRYNVLGAKSVIVEWRLGDGSQLRLIANFAGEPVSAPDVAKAGRILYASAEIPGAPESATFVLLQP